MRILHYSLLHLLTDFLSKITVSLCIIYLAYFAYFSLKKLKSQATANSSKWAHIICIVRQNVLSLIVISDPTDNMCISAGGCTSSKYHANLHAQYSDRIHRIHRFSQKQHYSVQHTDVIFITTIIETDQNPLMTQKSYWPVLLRPSNRCHFCICLAPKCVCN